MKGLETLLNSENDQIKLPLPLKCRSVKLEIGCVVGFANTLRNLPSPYIHVDCLWSSTSLRCCSAISDVETKLEDWTTILAFSPSRNSFLLTVLWYAWLKFLFVLRCSLSSLLIWPPPPLSLRSRTVILVLAVWTSNSWTSLITATEHSAAPIVVSVSEPVFKWHKQAPGSFGSNSCFTVTAANSHTSKVNVDSLTCFGWAHCLLLLHSKCLHATWSFFTVSRFFFSVQPASASPLNHTVTEHRLVFLGLVFAFHFHKYSKTFVLEMRKVREC